MMTLLFSLFYEETNVALLEERAKFKWKKDRDKKKKKGSVYLG